VSRGGNHRDRDGDEHDKGEGEQTASADAYSDLSTARGQRVQPEGQLRPFRRTIASAHGSLEAFVVANDREKRRAGSFAEGEETLPEDTHIGSFADHDDETPQ
jgi:hypothetical protein